jgi:oligopeptide transport system substrate-binding protein
MRTAELSPSAPRNVRLVLVSDEITALALFEQNSLDVLSRVPPFEAKKLKARGLLQVQPFWATYYLGFNTLHPVLAKSAVRCALASKIKKSEIVTALESDETVAESWVPPGLEGFYERSALPGAQKIEPGLKLQGAFDSNSRNQLIMEKIQADLKAAGVEVSLANRDWKTYLRELKDSPPDLFRMGWLAAFPDPISHLQALTTKNPNNLTRWSNPQYDRLVSQVEALEEGAERRSKVIEAQKIAVERDCAVVPLYHYVQVQGVSPRVLGYQANGMGVVRWENVSLRTAP